jgi:predicted transcriptional regulator
MTDKRLVRRRQKGRAYLFTAAANQKDVSQGMLGDLLDRVFDGSAEALLLNLLESEQVSDEDHRELRRIINRRQKES